MKHAEARTTKLVALTETAPDVTALLERLRQVQAEKAALLANLDAMPPMPPTIDTEAIVSKLKAHAADLVGLLSMEHGPKVRALSRWSTRAAGAIASVVTCRYSAAWTAKYPKC